MTIQLVSERFAKNKAILQEALNIQPNQVHFHNPSIFTTRNDFNGSEINKGEKFPVVMDPKKRTRFSVVERKQDGMFKVT